MDKRLSRGIVEILRARFDSWVVRKVYRDVVQLVRMLHLGCSGRAFESLYPDTLIINKLLGNKSKKNVEGCTERHLT